MCVSSAYLYFKACSRVHRWVGGWVHTASVFNCVCLSVPLPLTICVFFPFIRTSKRRVSGSLPLLMNMERSV